MIGYLPNLSEFHLIYGILSLDINFIFIVCLVIVLILNVGQVRRNVVPFLYSCVLPMNLYALTVIMRLSFQVCCYFT